MLWGSSGYGIICKLIGFVLHPIMMPHLIGLLTSGQIWMMSRMLRRFSNRGGGKRVSHSQTSMLVSLQLPSPIFCNSSNVTILIGLMDRPMTTQSTTRPQTSKASREASVPGQTGMKAPWPIKPSMARARALNSSPSRPRASRAGLNLQSQQRVRLLV